MNTSTTAAAAAVAIPLTYPWAQCTYVHGRGLRLVVGDTLYELVPYVAGGRGAEPAGYALVVDAARYGWQRFQGGLAAARDWADQLIGQGRI